LASIYQGRYNVERRRPWKVQKMSSKPDKKNGSKNSRREVEIDRGVYIVKGVAPKAGTKLTHKRITDDFRALNHQTS
jgi:hypothetical protein